MVARTPHAIDDSAQAALPSIICLSHFCKADPMSAPASAPVSAPLPAPPASTPADAAVPNSPARRDDDAGSHRIHLRFPITFLALLLAGFIIVSLPLVAGLVSSALSMERLLNKSERAVRNASQAKENARKLAGLIQTMERSARVYAVSPELDMLESYRHAREDFQGVLQQMAKLPLPAEMRSTTDAIGKAEQSVHAALGARDPVSRQIDKPLEQKLVVDFVQLGKRVQTLVQLGDKMIERDTEELRAYAETSKNQAYWQTVGMVPVAVFLIAGFAYALARPIRELDDAINRLGQGKLARSIRISGPRDIRQLGEQLDWLRQRLISLEDQKTRFFQHVSHELKTPLTALREGSDLLGDEVVGKLTEEQREVTRILKQNSLTLERLIQDLLTYSQSQSASRIAQKTALELKPLQLKDLIDEVIDAQKIAVTAKSLKIQRDCEKTSIMGDAGKLRVVIDNLLSNAVKYSPVGGTIVVRLGKRHDQAIMEVIDEGPGIPPEEREKIFDPFYRSQSAVATGTKGTGLGLAIVRDYVEMHQGSVSSIAADGARMRVVVPKQPKVEG